VSPLVSHERVSRGSAQAVRPKSGRQASRAGRNLTLWMDSDSLLDLRLSTCQWVEVPILCSNCYRAKDRGSHLGEPVAIEPAKV